MEEDTQVGFLSGEMNRLALENDRLRDVIRELVGALEVVVDRADKSKGAWLPHGPTIERCREALRKTEPFRCNRYTNALHPVGCPVH